MATHNQRLTPSFLILILPSHSFLFLIYSIPYKPAVSSQHLAKAHNADKACISFFHTCLVQIPRLPTPTQLPLYCRRKPWRVVDALALAEVKGRADSKWYNSSSVSNPLIIVAANHWPPDMRRSRILFELSFSMLILYDHGTFEVLSSFSSLIFLMTTSMSWSFKTLIPCTLNPHGAKDAGRDSGPP
ncbi:hypothetical protein PILCRDRAFT_321187 [Piloderma croceum F 1598]|uniref:Uncharacterized protein n=1 Tax=Piloderma croceum (strain F 1598) TaxID=765440 RepID=A0A0C3G332_PILCF|nr:hypothetical protein PILCRDRAFT_321187 [Piloderma croceum F 1598]